MYATEGSAVRITCNRRGTESSRAPRLRDPSLPLPVPKLQLRTLSNTGCIPVL